MSPRLDDRIGVARGDLPPVRRQARTSAGAVLGPSLRHLDRLAMALQQISFDRLGRNENADRPDAVSGAVKSLGRIFDGQDRRRPMPRHGDLASPADDPVEPLPPPRAARPSSARRALEIAWGLIVALVLLSAVGGVAYVLATGQT
jgi:hypothetical protein